ncbi:DegT/DnrJ/EryC1/StrS aminotransferase family protein [Arcticibacter pallidicorallinus]|uniref:DegT/DnrJ/EryC1/StrS aminotransferase family protein n=1 Tax=Arcticibacter pallidicorallinus TaxID=1259464 RepID=A0A2T0U6Y3_9SPHI|nr:DegT/DnrJ/EryC1/StrS family aminotransferase [Arcticibacter pallidicorallinus]PRY53673.1 DegT/DnrJ/EryC1/StrS aminotransferase family protein [Arcticibacter pallidicorallinus]
MKYFEGVVIDPDKFRVPNYNISPFDTESIASNLALLKQGQEFDLGLIKHLFGTSIKLFSSGKMAVDFAVGSYKLTAKDNVAIFTASDGEYISSCVTSIIDKYCTWTREITSNTKVILVIHDFGLVYKNMDFLKTFGLPIIEDRAMSLLSNNAEMKIGTYGDYTVYSVPKFFPIQYGGILQFNSDFTADDRDPLTEWESDLFKLICFYSKGIADQTEKRRRNYRLFEHLFEEIGILPRLKFSKREVPSVFMFTLPTFIDKIRLKTFLQHNGVEASLFYPENTAFIPVHQNLSEYDILFIFKLIGFFLKDEGFKSKD